MYYYSFCPRMKVIDLYSCQVVPNRPASSLRPCFVKASPKRLYRVRESEFRDASGERCKRGYRRVCAKLYAAGCRSYVRELSGPTCSSLEKNLALWVVTRRGGRLPGMLRTNLLDDGRCEVSPHLFCRQEILGTFMPKRREWGPSSYCGEVTF